MTPSHPSRARRIFGGWSAGLISLGLALTQQIVLIPVFLKYWPGETLAAWLTIFAAGSLVIIADAGLQIRSLNRFLSFRSRAGCERLTARHYGAMRWLFHGITMLVAALLIAASATGLPSRLLGFSGEPGFDVAFLIMTLGIAATIPLNLASALYRSHGLYGRIVGVTAWGLAIGQLGQIIAIVTFGSLLAVVVAYVAGQLLTVAFVLLFDLQRRFPFIAKLRPAPRPSWRWAGAQFSGAFPFAVMNFAEVGLAYLSVLLIGAFVTDRIAIAQWSLTRTIANLLRGLCTQMTLPLAAELGQDHAGGARDSLRDLYARGSVILVLFVSAATGGLLAFWPDFFAIWTHGAIPYNGPLALVLLLGTCVAAPAILALSYANYSNRGPLLLWTKSLQVAIFLGLSLVLIPAMGPLGAAIALVASDIIAQLGILLLVIIRDTLQRPVGHLAALAAIMLIVLGGGTALGLLIGRVVPGDGLPHFLGECAAWLVAMAVLASPLASGRVRRGLVALIPR